MEEKIKLILETYEKQTELIRQSLREAGLPDPLIFAYTINLPEFAKLVPDDVIKFYTDVRTLVILHLIDLGFSEREVGRRIGGSSVEVVRKTLEKFRPQKTATTEEVTKKLEVKKK